jgi:hypothetical protein
MIKYQYIINIFKNYWLRFLKVINKGLFTPSLHIINLQKNPLIRLFRVLSGIHIILILTKRLNYIENKLLYTIFS